MLPTGFYWLYPDRLAGGGRPGGSAYNQDTSDLADHLRSLASSNLRAILTLTETPLPDWALARAGVQALHLPVSDFTPPSPAQLLSAMSFIDYHHASGAAVYVHCLMGMGRTGTVMAAYLARAGYSPEAAIQRIRDLRPGSLCTPLQERAVADFARRREWIL